MSVAFLLSGVKNGSMGAGGFSGGGMAYFVRLMRRAVYFLVGLALSTVVVLAHADDLYPAHPDWNGYPSLAAYCQTVDYGTSYTYDDATVITKMTGTCNTHITEVPTVKQKMPVSAGFACNPGDNHVAGPDLSWQWCSPADSCIPPKVRNPTTGLCETPSNCTKSEESSIYKYAKGTDITGSYCSGGCSYTLAGDTSHSDYYYSGDYIWAWKTKYGNGTPCTTPKDTPAATPTNSPEGDCISKGMASGNVNGVVVCVRADTSGTTDKSSSTKTPTGSSAGSPTTTDSQTNTECTGPSCTTTTKNETTSGGSGPGGTGPGSSTSGTTESKTESKDSFCTENPSSKLCKADDKTSFAGTCGPGAAPACTGDAVQCAQAAAAWKIQCDMETEPTDAAYKAGQGIAGGGADTVMSPLDPSKLTTVDVGGIIATAAGQRSLTATCISSPSFTVMGKSFQFDTTNFCKFAQIVGYLMVAASSIIAIRMVTSGV